GRPAVRATGWPAGNGGAGEGVGPAAQPRWERDSHVYASLGRLPGDDLGGVPVPEQGLQPYERRGPHHRPWAAEREPGGEHHIGTEHSAGKKPGSVREGRSTGGEQAA